MTRRKSNETTVRREAGADGKSARREAQRTDEARYTLILYPVRKKLDISIAEYCLVDSVHKLSNARSSIAGWCVASKEDLGQSLGFARQSIHVLIKRLREDGLLEVQSQTGYLRATPKWIDAVEVAKALVLGA